MLNLLLTLCRAMCNLSVLALQPVPFVPARPDGTLLASVLPRLEYKPESSEDSCCNLSGMTSCEPAKSVLNLAQKGLAHQCKYAGRVVGVWCKT